MPEMNMEALIRRLLSDPACAISPAKNPIAVPECVPADVREFFSRCAGGRLYYDHDYKTPQFGCDLGFPPEQPVSQRLPCDGAELESLYVVAGFLTGEEDCVVVSAAPATFGHIYRLNYSLGDPELTIDKAFYLAPSFTRWLAMHVEAWEVYLENWREGLQHFGNLIELEREKIQ
jgi:hypothetical protein